LMGDFYRGTSFPALYHGALFFGDLNEGSIDAAIFDGAGQIVTIKRFATGLPATVQMLSGSDGHLYFVSLISGQVRRFRYDPQAPAAAIALPDSQILGASSEVWMVRSGQTIDVFGTLDTNRFEFIAGQTHTVIINGAEFNLKGDVSLVNIHGGPKPDSARLVGTTGRETATLRPKSGVFRVDGFEVHLADMEVITAQSGGGLRDEAHLYDSPGNDTLETYHDRVLLAGEGYTNEAIGFARTFSYAGTGFDTAKMYESSGNGRFRTSEGRIIMAGAGFYNHARGFENTLTYAAAAASVRLDDSVSVNLDRALAGSVSRAGKLAFRTRGIDRVLRSASVDSNIAHMQITARDELLAGWQRGQLARLKHSANARGIDQLRLENNIGEPVPVTIEALDQFFGSLGRRTLVAAQA
jgi:hypothetical protein